MTSVDDVLIAIERLGSENLDSSERNLLCAIVNGYVDEVAIDNESNSRARRHAESEHDRWFVTANQLSEELKGMRDEVHKCRGEVAAISKGAARLCIVLHNKPLSAEAQEAVDDMKAALKGERSRHFSRLLDESIRRFDALRIFEQMLRKLEIDGEKYQRARDWAVKKLRP